MLEKNDYRDIVLFCSELLQPEKRDLHQFLSGIAPFYNPEIIRIVTPAVKAKTLSNTLSGTSMNPIYNQKLLERFLGYVKFDTTSDPNSVSAPSTVSQLRFAASLAHELQALGAQNVVLHECGVVMGVIPASPGFEQAPSLGLIAHMDTSPEAAGAHVNARRITYNGISQRLDKAGTKILSTEQFPELAAFAGRDLIVTDGSTLLGADDKAGVSIIMTVAEFICTHRNLPHATIKIAFTPDEEIGRGTEHFDLIAFGADYAFTVDGGERATFDTNTFNAAVAHIEFFGVNVHPGTAKNKMRNALKAASEFICSLPADEAPENTDGWDGFFHPISLSGDVSHAVVQLLIRDHDDERFQLRKQYLRDMAITHGVTSTLTISDQYYNMARALRAHPEVLALARQAYRDCGLEPIEKPVRGGTDGAWLTAQGLPCPNIFTGGMNFHSPFECLCIADFEKAFEVVLRLCELSAKVGLLNRPMSQEHEQ